MQPNHPPGFPPAQAMPAQWSAPLPHSGLGVASFIISLMASVLLCVAFITLGAIEMDAPGSLDEDSAVLGFIGLLMLFTGMAQLVALGLGIAGIVQTGRQKIFGVLGTSFAALSLLGTLFLILIGIAAEL